MKPCAWCGRLTFLTLGRYCLGCHLESWRSGARLPSPLPPPIQPPPPESATVNVNASPPPGTVLFGATSPYPTTANLTMSTGQYQDPSMKEHQPESHPDLVAGPIVAFRAWMYDPATCTLCALFGGWGRNASNKTWAVGFPSIGRHEGASSNHRVPGPACHCGIWALKRWDVLARTIQGPAVYGQVALWGRVIEHRLGYRAQYAYPVSLWASPVWADERPPLPRGFPGHAMSDPGIPEYVAALARQYNIVALPGPPPSKEEGGTP